MLGRGVAGRGLEVTAVGNEAYSLVAELLLTHRGAGSRYLLRVTDQSIRPDRWNLLGAAICVVMVAPLRT
ncbi:MAG: hypothetical protein M3R38_03600 [Actinomycetota bacterium]|nr:hypothetical protein [Actinomycetota bacterium]